MSKKDLWEQIYVELSPDHSDVMKSTKFADVPWTERYQQQFGTIDIDIDSNIIVYGSSMEKLEFAHRVAEYYHLPYRDRKSPGYKRKYGDGAFNYECKIDMRGTYKI